MPKSIYSEPMLSPNGTNYERLYIVRKPLAMAMDSAGGPVDRFSNYNANLAPPDGSGGEDIDLNSPDSGGDDLGDKIRQLLEGKLDNSDIAMLLQLIERPDDTAPAQDRRWQAGDRSKRRSAGGGQEAGDAEPQADGETCCRRRGPTG